ncbi:ROK family protein [Lentzea flava]|uniref:Sugar kinase n=1 Tax=Lentzea flava TaxID=103732 RepID=A0ABQ2UHD5_9PSEU|nr:ROK family protein [Lentzea flava]MCP2201730.1 Sugar kinase of the NBD/HSP70 family, may containing an N-terminal HTH domain [Lentzea flava]GGU28311.1 sugar kinase [Lentzea flava]
MRLRHSGDLRRAHRVEIMRSFYGGEPRTRLELANQLGLSVATIGTIVGELTKAGFLRETAGPRTGGRPATRLTLRGGGSLVVGVEVAGTSVTVELFDQAMARLARKRVPVVESAPDAVVEHVLAAVAAVRQQVYEAPVSAIGVSLPEHPFRSLLERRCDVPVVLDKPVKALTLAEQLFGAARDRDDVIVVDLGTGVGLGVVADGRVVRGATNSAGEWGHTVLEAGGEPCRCGGRGCVEAYAGAEALVRLLEGGPLFVPGDVEASVARLAEAVRRGDSAALETLEKFARPLGHALAGAVTLLDPALIVFGGWVGAALGEPLVSAVTPVIKEYALATPFEAATAALGGHLGNPVSLGMAVLAFETHLLD